MPPSGWWLELFAGPWADARLASPADPAVAWQEAASIRWLLGLSTGDRVLDVPSGDGRLPLSLASWGIRTLGVDIEPTMIANARARSAALRLPAEFLESDMRALPFTAEFDAALCTHGSFGYFGDEENAAFLRAVFTALRPGGRFLLHTPAVETLLPRFQSQSSQPIAGGVVHERSDYDPETSRVESSWLIVRGTSTARASSSIRLYALREITALLGECGFEQVTAHGSLTGTPFRLGAEILVVVATRPAEPAESPAALQQRSDAKEVTRESGTDS